MKTSDVIVLGLGGVGSATLYHLARRGVRATGIDQFGIAHDRGSSHGESRLIRRAYFEHPNYVPLVDRALRDWRTIEQDTQSNLLYRTGLLLAGPPESSIVVGTRRAAAAHHLDIPSLTPAELTARFPGFRPPSEVEILFEPEAATLPVERCVEVCLEAAQRKGATVHLHERALGWSSSGHHVTVETEIGTHHADSLIIAAGPWANDLLKDLGLPLILRRKPFFWFATRDPCYRRDRGCPVFWFEIDGHSLYGFPSLDGRTIKMGDHAGGDQTTRVDDLDRSVSPDDTAPLIPFIRSCLPGVEPRVVRHSVCIYTMTPDAHFIVDRHPLHPNVAFVAGLSGHGFKFAPVLGSALADLVLSGRTDEPIGFLNASRPALRTPSAGPHGQTSLPMPP